MIYQDGHKVGMSSLSGRFPSLRMLHELPMQLFSSSILYPSVEMDILIRDSVGLK